MNNHEKLAHNKSVYEGQTMFSKDGEEFVIIEYTNTRKVSVQFTETGYVVQTTLDNARKGSVRDKMLPTVHGVGVMGEQRGHINGVPLTEYILWSSMLGRCYSNNRLRKQQSYSLCGVSDNFKYLPYFKEWCNTQVGFKSLDDKGKAFALDKDILVKGNKLYSEDTCCFVPEEINSLFIKSSSCKITKGLGVYFHRRVKKYAATIGMYGKSRHLGYFDTPEEAFYVYKTNKEVYIKEMANKWKDQIDHRTHEALMNWEIEITD